MSKPKNNDPKSLSSLSSQPNTSVKHAAVDLKNDGSIQASASWFHSGPLPPPDELEHYEKIFPGITKWMMEKVNSEAQHRQSFVDKKLELESKQQSRDFIRSMSGLAAAFFTVTFFIALSGFLIHRDHEGFGLFGLLGNLAALVGVFVYNRKAKPSAGNTPP